MRALFIGNHYMRLVLVTTKPLTYSVYEGKVLLAAFALDDVALTPKEVEDLRTANYDEKA